LLTPAWPDRAGVDHAVPRAAGDRETPRLAVIDPEPIVFARRVAFRAALVQTPAIVEHLLRYANRLPYSSVHLRSRPGGCRVGGLRVNARFDLNGRYRRAILASPPSLARVRVRVPDGAALRFGIGVAREGPRDRSATGVRFSISVDDAEIFERVLNPARDRSDQHWFDERVDLASFAGREVDIGLRTSTVGAGSAGGTAGWSNVRLVRRQWRE